MGAFIAARTTISRSLNMGGGVIARVGMVREQSYTDISNIRIIKMRILYLLSRRFSRIISRS